MSVTFLNIGSDRQNISFRTLTTIEERREQKPIATCVLATTAAVACIETRWLFGVEKIVIDGQVRCRQNLDLGCGRCVSSLAPLEFEVLTTPLDHWPLARPLGIPLEVLSLNLAMSVSRDAHRRTMNPSPRQRFLFCCQLQFRQHSGGMTGTTPALVRKLGTGTVWSP